MNRLHPTVIAGVVLLLSGWPVWAQEDRHEGYYYPKPQSVETYTARVNTLPHMDRERRLSFVTGLTQQLLGGQYAPPYAVFAKGAEAEKLIIVGLADGQLNTLYRARALLATLTAVSRLTPLFQENTDPDQSTFFDFLKLLGFRQLTISDGRDFAHQVILE